MVESSFESAFQMRENILRCIEDLSSSKIRVDIEVVQSSLKEFMDCVPFIVLEESTAELYFSKRVKNLKKNENWWKRFLMKHCPQMRNFFIMVKNYNRAKDLFEINNNSSDELLRLQNLPNTDLSLLRPNRTEVTLGNLEKIVTNSLNFANKSQEYLIQKSLDSERRLVESLKESWLLSRSSVSTRLFSLRKELHKMQDNFGCPRTEGAMLTEENILSTLNKIFVKYDKKGKAWTEELVQLKDDLTGVLEETTKKKRAYDCAALVLRDKERAMFRMTRPATPACLRNAAGFGIGTLSSFLTEGQYVLPFDRNDIFRCMSTKEAVEAAEAPILDATLILGETETSGCNRNDEVFASRFSGGTLNIVVIVNPLDTSDGNDKCFTGRLSQDQLSQEFVIPGKKYVTWRYVRKVEFGATKEQFRARMLECERYLDMFETRPDLCNQLLQKSMENFSHRLHVVTLFDEFLDVEEWGCTSQEWVINTVDDWAFKLNCFEPYGYNQPHNNALHKKMLSVPSVVACTEMFTLEDEWPKLKISFKQVEVAMDKFENGCMHLKNAVLVDHKWELLSSSIIVVRQLLKDIPKQWNIVMQQHSRTGPILRRIVEAIQQELYMKEFQSRLEPGNYTGQIQSLQSAMEDTKLKQNLYKNWVMKKYEPMRIRIENKVQPWEKALDSIKQPIGLTEEKLKKVWKVRQEEKQEPNDEPIDLDQLKLYCKRLCLNFKDVQGLEEVPESRKKKYAKLLKFREKLNLACIVHKTISKLS